MENSIPSIARCYHTYHLTTPFSPFTITTIPVFYWAVYFGPLLTWNPASDNILFKGTPNARTILVSINKSKAIKKLCFLWPASWTIKQLYPFTLLMVSSCKLMTECLFRAAAYLVRYLYYNSEIRLVSVVQVHSFLRILRHVRMHN